MNQKSNSGMVQCCTAIADKLIRLADFLSPLVYVAIRLWMASIFWKSGMLKIQDWDTTILLFTDEHPVPGIPPVIAAYSAVTFELLCPVLLTLGFATRLATLPMLAMTAVIQFTYLSHTDHLYWALLLSVLLFTGPGKLSIDHLIRKKCMTRKA